MADTPFALKDANLLPKSVLVEDNGATVSPIHVVRGRAFSSAGSIGSLSAPQAAGTAVILAANDARKALKIVPPADCLLRLASGGSGAGGIPLFGGVTNDFSGQDCPIGALYITGLTAGVAVTIWEG